ncbi:MAG: hypothetical protein P4L16_03845 [Chlamydiales bacterium]|nr:hypothetical protein [Chlamydiales bacterium]
MMHKSCALLLVFVSSLLFSFTAGRDAGVCVHDGFEMQKIYMDDGSERVSILLPKNPSTLFKNGCWYVYSYSKDILCYISTFNQGYKPPATVEDCIREFSLQAESDDGFTICQILNNVPGVPYCVEYSYLDSSSKHCHVRFVATKQRGYYIRIFGELEEELKQIIFNSLAVSITELN